MPFGEFTIMKIPRNGEKEIVKECLHSMANLISTKQSTNCAICGQIYYIIKCTECGQQFSQCALGGCDNGKRTKWH